MIALTPVTGVEARHPGTVTPQLAPALTQLVERLTRRDATERYQTAVDLVADPNAVRDRMGSAHARGPANRAVRNRVASGLAGAVVVAAGAAGVFHGSETARSAGTQAHSLAVLPLKTTRGLIGVLR
jgi:hypothetical protein